MAALTSPVFPGKTQGLETARDRWRRRAAAALSSNVPLDIVRQAYLYDLDRISKGGTPMSDREAAVAVLSAQGLGGETGREGGGLLGFAENAASDLRDIVMGLPQLPQFLLEEPARMGDPEKGLVPMVTEGVQKLTSGDISGLGQIAGAPGVRLLPGSFTAEMIGRGAEGDKGPGELVEHPVFTFLDLLPIASKAGLTDKALKAVKESSPFKRAAAGLERRGVGGAAVDANRMFQQTQRAADEGTLGEAPLGRSGVVGTHAELRELLIGWLDEFSDREIAESWDLLEQGEWRSGAPAPKWARDTGRGDAWVAMAEDTKAMTDFWSKHGEETGEILMVNGEAFPNTPRVRRQLKDLMEARQGKKKTAKRRETAEESAAKATAKAAEAAADVARLERIIAAADPIRLSEEITRVADSTQKLTMPDLGVDADVRVLQDQLAAERSAVEAASPKVETVIDEAPWPDDVPPLRPGEQGWLDGERSPVTEGERVVTKRYGRQPTTEAARLRQVRRRIDGSVVGEHADELLESRRSAEANLSKVSALRRLTPDKARNVKAAVEGRLTRGSLVDRVRSLNEDLGDAAFDLDETIQVTRVDNLGRETTVETTRLDVEVDALKSRGWSEKTVDGELYSVSPSEIRIAQLQRTQLKRLRARLEASAEESGAHPAGSPEAAGAVRERIQLRLLGPIRKQFHRRLRRELSGRVEAIRDPSDYQISHPTEMFREGVDFPTRLTAVEKNLIRRGTSKTVIDGDGVLWEVHEYFPPGYEGRASATWGARRKLKDGSYELDEFVDAELDKMASAEPWDEADLGAFNAAERESMTAESLDRILDELVDVADVPPDEAFVTSAGRTVSVAAQRVLDRAAEVLPEWLGRLVSDHSIWAPVRDLADGQFSRAGVKIVESSSKQAGRMAEVASALERVEQRIATLEKDAAAATRAADEVLAAELAVERAVQSQGELLARVRAVEAGKAGAGLREVREAVTAHPDEAGLRTLYDQLDDIEATGPSHPLYSARDEMVAAAEALEAAGIRVKPSVAKSKALLGLRKQRKITHPGDAAALKSARAARDKTARSVKSAQRRAGAVATAFSVLKAKLVGTVEKPGLLREAEAAARTGDFTTARRKLVSARKSLDTKTMVEVKRLAGKTAPDLAAELSALETRLAAIHARLPTTKGVSDARKRLESSRKRVVDQSKRLESATERAEAATVKIAAEMTDAEKAAVKWSANPRNLPARLQPMYRRVLTNLLAERLRKAPPSPEAVRKLTFDKVQEAAKEAGVPAKEWRAMTREAMTVMEALRAQGFEPMWLPHRQIGNRGRAPGKLFGDRIVTPQQFKQRYLNPEPYIRNLAVALEQTSVDHIRRAATEALYFGDEAAGIPGIFPSFGKTWDELMDMYSDEIAAQMDANPHVPPQNIAQRVLSRDWASVDPRKWGMSEKWAPQSKIKYARKGIGTAEEVEVAIENIYVPKGVAKTIEGFQKTGGLMPFRGVYDQILDVFRVSALALSPRFLVYNAIGGLAMLMGRTDPTVLTYFKSAKDMIDEGKMPVEISKGAAMVDPEFTKAFTQDISRLATDKRTGFMWGIGEGRWLGEVFNNVQRAANRSFAINEWFDNLYRSAAYLYESDRALAKGASRAEAAESGVRLANKILQDWDAMTPWERTIMRRIFPFYGWMKHVLKYTFTLPYDHPLRVSVITNFAANEMEDYRSGIPQWMAHTFFIGKPGPDTKQWSVNLRSVNPFSDVARYVDFDSREYGSGVVLGFMTQMSPVLSAAAEAMGVNPMSGRSRLYPEMAYDPEQGRLRAVAPSIIHTLPKAIVPQVEGVAGLVELSGVASASRELRNMRVRDPDAFVGRVWSSFGMPFAPRRQSKPFRLIRAGLAREQAAGEAVNRALRTGDWTDALRYDRARIRGQTFKVDNLYNLAKRNPEMLEAILSAASR